MEPGNTLAPRLTTQQQKKPNVVSPQNLQRVNQIIDRVKATAEVMGCPISAEALELFAFDLLPYPDDRLAEALVRCRREISTDYGKRLGIKDVLDRLGVVTPEQEVSAAADLAWVKITQCFYKCAECPEQHLSHKDRDRLMASGDARLVHAIRVCGGWHRITETRPKDYGFLKRDFVQAYATYDVAREVELQSLPQGDVKRLISGSLAKWPK